MVFLLLVYIWTDPITLPCSLARAGNNWLPLSETAAIRKDQIIREMRECTIQQLQDALLGAVSAEC